MSYTVRDTCRLCDAPLPDERVLDLGETPLANGLRSDWRDGPISQCETYPLYLKQCTQCGHVQLPVVVDPKLLFPADYPYCSSVGDSMRRHLDRMALSLHKRDGLVVEIGSNDGYLLREFWRYGMRVVGVDPAGKPTNGAVLTVPTFFDTTAALAIKSACGPVDLVVANNVFAHSDCLDEIVEGVKVLLAHEGRFIVEVGYLPDVLRTNNFGVVYHEHLAYWTVTVLEWWLRTKFDLHMYDAEHIETQGGSVRCHIARGARSRTDRMQRFVRDEPVTAGPEQFTGWQSRVNVAAAKFRADLLAQKQAGKTIAGYGCSAKSTTLLHVAGIGRETIDFICDSNPLKQGRFSPGKHIPIVHPDELERRQPDYCVSLSSNFSEQFRARHPNYRGTWIEPDLSGQSVAA